MMRSYDRCIERFAEQAASWSLACIRFPELLIPMQPGHVRFWSKKQSGWVRTNLATKDSAPELPGNMLDPSTQMVLLLCMDQASTNHAVANFLPSPGGGGSMAASLQPKTPFTGHTMIGSSLSGMRLAGSNTQFSK